MKRGVVNFLYFSIFQFFLILLIMKLASTSSLKLKKLRVLNQTTTNNNNLNESIKDLTFLNNKISNSEQQTSNSKLFVTKSNKYFKLNYRRSNMPTKFKIEKSFNNNNNNNIQLINSNKIKNSNLNSISTIPILMPAVAQITSPKESFPIEKRKKNFSKLAKSLMSTKTFDKKSLFDFKATRSYATQIEEQTRLKLFEIGGYCETREDGLYDDPDDCENFIICFAGRTFRTKCAYGTMWNHIRKECDFPDKVDCERKPATTEPYVENTTMTQIQNTTKKRTTIHQVPKLSSIFTITPNADKNIKTDPNLASSIRTNILLTVIIIPLALFSLFIIIVSLWFWNRKFNQQKKELELTHTINLTNRRNSRQDYELSDGSSVFSKTLGNFCCCKKMATLKENRRQFSPSIMGSFNGSRGDRIRSQSVTSLSNQVNKDNYKITYSSQKTNTNTNSNNTNMMNMHDLAIIGIDNCQIATGSHVTLSSHFEENNWDYNFATRGLYLSQPWVRGRYTQTLGSESANTSAVINLEPTTTDAATGEPSSTKLVEIYTNGENLESDTDGYYA